jgi:acyl carrier protein
MDKSSRQNLIFNKMRAILCKELKVKPETVASESHIKEDLGADSSNIISMIMTIEDEFKIPISDETAKTFVKFGDIVAYISSRKNTIAQV